MMIRVRSVSFACLMFFAAVGCGSAVSAHAVCGSRVFPATLGIDDPGVGDELALPTLTYLPTNGNGQNEADIDFSYTKTIVPNFGVSISTGAQFTNPQGWGRSDLTTKESYEFFCWPELEFMGTASFSQDWGQTSTNGMGNGFNTYAPVLDVGIGMGSLLKSAPWLRPLALTGEISYSTPDQSWTRGTQNPTTINWGFTVQYSLPYLNANIMPVENPILKRLIPLTEFTFSKPTDNYSPGGNITTGTVQPGLMYMANTWQLSAEAILPLNSASGRGVGVVGELHFFLDDLAHNTWIGKPLFGVRQ